MNFEDLPDEKIYEICDQMDVNTLYNFVRTSKSNFQLCAKLLDDKVDRLIKQDESIPSRYGDVVYIIRHSDKSIIFVVQNFRNKIITVKQEVIYNDVKSDEWIFDDILPYKTVKYSKEYQSKDVPYSKKLLDSLIKRFYMMGGRKY